MSSPDKAEQISANDNGFAQHLNWSNIPIERPAEGIERQMIVGDNLMICRFRFAPLLVTPEHDHPHEQMTIVEAVGSRQPRRAHGLPLLVTQFTGCFCCLLLPPAACF